MYSHRYAIKNNTKNKLDFYNHISVFKGKGTIIFTGKCTINDEAININHYTSKSLKKLLYTRMYPPCYKSLNALDDQFLPKYKNLFPKKDDFIQFEARSDYNDTNLVQEKGKIKLNNQFIASNVISHMKTEIQVLNDIIAYKINAKDFSKIGGKNIEVKEVTADGRFSLINADNQLIAQNIIGNNVAKILSKNIYTQHVKLTHESKIKCNKFLVQDGYVSISDFSEIHSNSAYLSNCEIDVNIGRFYTNHSIVFDNCDLKINIPLIGLCLEESMSGLFNS